VSRLGSENTFARRCAIPSAPTVPALGGILGALRKADALLVRQGLERGAEVPT
jgi:hypothetical protein